MNRLPSILITIGVFFLLDLYVFQAVRTLTRGLSLDARRLIHAIYWAIPIVSLGIWIVTQFLMPADSLSRMTRQFIWTGLLIPYFAKVFALFFVLLDDVVRFGKWVISLFGDQAAAPSPAVGEPTIPRSEFLMKSALAVAGTTVAGFTYGIISGAHDYRIRRIKVPLKNLPKAFEGIKIAQLSDIHSGSFFNKTAVKGGVEMLMEQKPDLFFFTGDLVNNTADEVKDYIDIFKKIKAPLGTFSVLGNHDYGDYYQWPSAEAKRRNLLDLKEAHQLLGWDLLVDEHRAIKVGNEQIGLLGIQNWGMGGFAQYGSLERAAQNTEDFPVKLLLSHDPSHWNAQVTTDRFKDIDVAFAGHTHGMQFGVEVGGFQWSPVQYRYKQWGGLYTQGEQHLYVNRGFGYIGYPGRVGILPEITILELVRG
ncbi:metallophosphoesterase [Runella sp. MFBS21]|uniref:metallophosphoesterase n=1 Tax=Runella sp. MFBS21 TaxID=3034018 RepID=UPI0023F6427C|nr:metallophosphoesterase [Runella sp. MFBS21]MDF7820464.1 metallophosphoesterase [Runella sp. MFBS21]